MQVFNEEILKDMVARPDSPWKVNNCAQAAPVASASIAASVA